MKQVAWPEGYGRRVLATVDSTLEEARRIAPGLEGPDWIMARRLTNGRGRRGRPWRDPEGNLAATLVIPGGDDPARAALRSFVAALALREAAVGFVGPEAGFALKWPNDVLLNGGKLAGILLESSGMGREGAYLAIGSGGNMRAVPEQASVEAGALRPVSLAAECGIEVDPEVFFDALAVAYAGWEVRFQTFGFAPIREAWMAHAARLGEEIVARTGRETFEGRFETLDEDGNLVLATDKGRKTIAAGDIFF